MAGELRDFVRSKQLPLDWLAVDPDDLQGIDYPHLIFARLTADEDWPAESRVGGRIISPQFRWITSPAQDLSIASRALRGSFEVYEGHHLATNMHLPADRSADEALVVTLADGQDPSRSLFFGTWPNGCTRLLVTRPASLVQIFQAADGRCSWNCAVDDKSRHQQFDSAEALAADPYFTEKVAAYLKQHGLEIRSGLAHAESRP